MKKESIAAAHNDEYWMKKALLLAEKSAAKKEIPVGALIVKDNKLVSTGTNCRETKSTPLGHAELVAIQKASQKLNSWRLLDCTLYVTLEPCVMCAGAIVQARIPRVVFGTLDPKAGAVESVYEILSDKRLNHRAEITSGICANECSQILKDFFKKLRSEK